MRRARSPSRTRSLSSQSGLPRTALDPVPVQVEPHEVDAEPLQPVEPVVERAGAVREPGVVLDPEADAARGACGSGADEQAPKISPMMARRIAGGFPTPLHPTRESGTSVNDPPAGAPDGARRAETAARATCAVDQPSRRALHQAPFAASGDAPCALHEGRVADRREPDVGAEGERGGQELQDSAHQRHASNRTRRGRVKTMARRDVDRLQEEIEELFADLWQVPRFAGAARLPARRRLLHHRRAAPAERRRRAGRRRPGLDRDRCRRASTDDLRRAAAAAGRRAGLPAGGDRVRAASNAASRSATRSPRLAASAVYEAGMLRITLPIAKRAPRGACGHDRRPQGRMSEQAPPTEADGLRLPVLPLKETVVFPESMTPLAVGQERSVKLIDDVVSGERMLALITVRNPEAEPPGWGDLYRRRDGRGRPQDDQGSRRDAADPRPGAPARPARRAAAGGAVPGRRAGRAAGRRPGLARGRGADPERPAAVRPDHRDDAVPARGAPARRGERRRSRARSAI